ncbi:MAG: shikimate dehydrogenase [Candidatus Omnitrophota bacterium]
MNKWHSPQIYGILGYPITHSLSPAMHNAAFKALGIDAEYTLFEVKPEELERFLLEDSVVTDIKGTTCKSSDIAGLNITIPHKIKAKEILEKNFPTDSSYPAQENFYYVTLSGAINTVKRMNRGWQYYNTDAHGFLRSLEGDLKFVTEDKKVLVIGCGGAGRAIIAALSWKNMQISKIYASDIRQEAMEAAKQHFGQFAHLENKLKFVVTEDIPEVIKECDLLVNASPVGMKKDDGSVVDKKLFHSNLFVYDVVYNRETALIKDAASQGLPGAGGLGMLLYQGVKAFELWTGKPAPVEKMRSALTEGL